MNARELHCLRQAEDRLWWYDILHGLASGALDARLPPRAYALDAGCGTGGMIATHQKKRPHCEWAGVDASEIAVRHCQERRLERVCRAPVEQLPFADEVFDAVLSLDVLYHQNVDEEAAMKEMRRVLKSGGILVINLPAFECLRGRHDIAVCGIRRYTRSQVRALLEGHSLQVEMIHYWNSWLFLPLLLWRRLSLALPAAYEEGVSDLSLTPSWLNRFLKLAGRVDALLGRALQLPFGTSVFAVARKTGTETKEARS